MKFRSAVAGLALLSPALAPALRAQGSLGGDDPYGNFRTLTREESVKALDNFRNYRARGDQRLRFTITHAERDSDDDTRYAGELCATWTGSGRLVRVEIRPEGRPDTERRRFLIVDGDHPAVYSLSGDGKVVRADADALKPLLPGLVFTPYDLQLPFTRWPEFKYKETDRFRTRPTDYFMMSPPPAFRKDHPEISGVLLGFDRAYNALMRAETLDGDGSALREIRAESFGKIQGRWTIVEMRLRDEKTRAADTLKIGSAALGLALPASVFEPAALATPLPVTPESSFEKAD